MTYVFANRPQPTVPVSGTDALFPVNRIYCVGKNYAAHIREMGADLGRDAVCFFMKPADAVVTGDRVPYPPGTHNLHYEGELVIALGKGGANIAQKDALDHVFGHRQGVRCVGADFAHRAGGGVRALCA